VLLDYFSARRVPAGDSWLQQNLDGYDQWAKSHNSLLIVTFDENDDKGGYRGLTDPSVSPDHDKSRHDLQNRIATIFAGAHVKPKLRRARWDDACQHPAHHRGDVRVAQIGCTAAQCAPRQHQR
jgi:hypothetical protein